MTIKIIPLSDGYIEGFRQAVGSVAREKRYITFFDAPTAEMTNEFIQLMRKNNMPQFIAVTDDDRVIGWCDISPLDRPVFQHVGCLGMGIIEGYREKGIGKRLIQAALDAAKLRGLKRIELTVWESNARALHVYESMGFKKEGFHYNTVLIDGKYENHHSMALLF